MKIIAALAALAAVLLPAAAPAQTEPGERTLKGIVVLTRPGDVRESGWPATELRETVDVSRVPQLRIESLVRSLRALVGKPLSPELARSIERLVAGAYEGLGHPSVSVSIPEQRVPDGIVQVLAEPRGPVLKGIIVLNRPTDLRKGGWPASALRDPIDVSRVPDLQKPEVVELLRSVIGAPIDKELLESVQVMVSGFYQGLGRQFVNVTVPEQDVTDGVVQVLAVEGRLGELRVEGSRWFHEGQYRETVGAKPGERIDLERLQADVDWLNRNTYRRATILTAPGSEVGTTDVVVRIQEEFPLRFTAGFDNTGNEATGKDRLNLGIEYGNLFGLGHIVGYRVTADREFDRSVSHNAYATIFLPWRHLLTLTGLHTESTSKPLPDFTSDGKTTEAAGRYLVPLPGRRGFSHEATLGFDYKRTNNFLAFGGTQVFDTISEIAQFSLGYNASLDDPFGNTRVTGTLFGSPGGLTGHNKDRDFNALRAGASADYSYGRVVLERNTLLSWDLAWVVRATGQLASERLLPSEQLTFGGYQSVRGFGESLATRDAGLLVSTELRSPSITPGLFKRLRLPWLDEQVQGLVFLDYGRGRTLDPRPGEASRVELMSMGLGLRFAFGRYLSARLDFGFPIQHTPFSDPRKERVHFGVTATY